MRRLLREHADIAVKLVISLGRRLREANERLARQSFQTVQSRVAVVLDGLVRQAQSEGAEDKDIEVGHVAHLSSLVVPITLLVCRSTPPTGPTWTLPAWASAARTPRWPPRGG